MSCNHNGLHRKRLLDNKEEELIHLCHARKELEIQLNQMSLSLETTDR